MLRLDDSTRNSMLKPPYFYTKPYLFSFANIIRIFMSSFLSNFFLTGFTGLTGFFKQVEQEMQESLGPPSAGSGHPPSEASAAGISPERSEHC